MSQGGKDMFSDGFWMSFFFITAIVCAVVIIVACGKGLIRKSFMKYYEEGRYPDLTVLNMPNNIEKKDNADIEQSIVNGMIFGLLLSQFMDNSSHNCNCSDHKW